MHLIPDLVLVKLFKKGNAGAIGYIGGSDVTYWDEDYWWVLDQVI